MIASVKITAASIVEMILALDDDFDAFWGRRFPPSADQIDSLERTIGLPLSADHRGLIELIGAGAIVAKQSVWPAPNEFETRPLWQFWRGLEFFGYEASGRTPPLDLALQVKQRAMEGEIPLVPCYRRIGDTFCFGYDADGVIYEWEATGREPPRKVHGTSMLELISNDIRSLTTNKERMKNGGG